MTITIIQLQCFTQAVILIRWYFHKVIKDSLLWSHNHQHIISTRVIMRCMIASIFFIIIFHMNTFLRGLIHIKYNALLTIVTSGTMVFDKLCVVVFPESVLDLAISRLQLTFIVIGLEKNNNNQLVLIIHWHGCYGICIYRSCDVSKYSQESFTFRIVFLLKAWITTPW